MYGWYKGGAGTLHQEELFPTRFALDPAMIAEKIGDILVEEGRGTEGIRAGLETVRAARHRDNAPDIAARLPYFLFGLSAQHLDQVARRIARLCRDRVPHHGNVDGSRDIGLYPHGGRGGELDRRGPVFQTRSRVPEPWRRHVHHSGILAVRAALAADVNITYKILYNDAVAMTGGQQNEGGLSPDRIARELLAMGVKRVEVVFDPKEEPERSAFPKSVGWHERDALPSVQDELAKTPG